MNKYYHCASHHFRFFKFLKLMLPIQNMEPLLVYLICHIMEAVKMLEKNLKTLDITKVGLLIIGYFNLKMIQLFIFLISHKKVILVLNLKELTKT
jgi:hypothetical protein